jgi:hypothetical protein
MLKKLLVCTAVLAASAGDAANNGKNQAHLPSETRSDQGNVHGADLEYCFFETAGPPRIVMPCFKLPPGHDTPQGF